MKTKAIFYHAGCPVCVAAEQNVASALDPQRFELEVVHLGQEKRRVFEAERTGVKSVPALVFNNHAYRYQLRREPGHLEVLRNFDRSSRAISSP